MIDKNSGKFFRFKLNFGIGFGFAEAYDFRDVHSADGSIVFVYNLIDIDAKRNYDIEEITSTGISLGPIRLVSYPNGRGIGAWKYLFKHDSYILEEPNLTKEVQDLAPWIYDWNTLTRWHKSNWDPQGLPDFVPYAEVRSLETRIINTNSEVVMKATMKKLIDDELDIRNYYDLSDLGNRNMFLQLINTYYPLVKTKELIELIPKEY